MRTMIASDARPCLCFSAAHGFPAFLKSRVCLPLRQRIVIRIKPSMPPPACNPPAPLGISAPGKVASSVRIRYREFAMKPPMTKIHASMYNRSPSRSCDCTDFFLSSPLSKRPRCRQRCCLIIQPITIKAASGWRSMMTKLVGSISTREEGYTSAMRS